MAGEAANVSRADVGTETILLTYGGSQSSWPNATPTALPRERPGEHSVPIRRTSASVLAPGGRPASGAPSQPPSIPASRG